MVPEPRRRKRHGIRQLSPWQGLSPVQVKLRYQWVLDRSRKKKSNGRYLFPYLRRGCRLESRLAVRCHVRIGQYFDRGSCVWGSTSTPTHTPNRPANIHVILPRPRIERGGGEVPGGRPPAHASGSSHRLSIVAQTSNNTTRPLQISIPAPSNRPSRCSPESPVSNASPRDFWV